jgi:hypothetical protein
MGHLRLGKLPNTKKWRHVVALVAGENSALQVAHATMEAAKRGLEVASTDEGLRHAVWFLTQIPLAAKQEDFTGALKKVGISVPTDPTVLDIVSGFSEALDRKLQKSRNRTDI